MNRCDSRTRSSAARISSRMPAYCAFRSSSGTPILFPSSQRRGMVFLKRPHVQALASNRAYPVDRGCGARDRSDAGHMMGDRCAADCLFVEEGFAAERRIDDEIDLAALDVVDDMRPAFINFINGLNIDAGTTKHLRRSARRNDLETDFDEVRDNP